MHYGRYGKDSDSDRLGSLFLGDGSLIRGYSYESFSASECSPNGTGALAASSCPEFDRLLGSRLALANIELRLPVFGTDGFGLIRTALPPMELSAFLDAGTAWTGSSSPVLQLSSTSTDRAAVASAGIATRWNLFGAAVLQIYYAHPFQRATRSGVFGFLLQPGW
jgi:outer membrane protein assembly factor BamA